MLLEKYVKKAKEKGVSYQTVRRDIAYKLILNNECIARCEYHYTDDYAFDSAYNFGKRGVTKETVLKDMELINSYCYVSTDKPNKLMVRIHSNLLYSVEFLNNNTNNNKNTKTPVKQADQVELKINEKLNGIELIFNGSLNEQTTKLLKQNGFRYSWKQKKWYTKKSDEKLNFAEAFVLSFNDVLENDSNNQTNNNKQEQQTDNNTNDNNEQTITNEDNQTQNKIKMKSITFEWSESNLIKDNTTVTSFSEAENMIQQAARKAPSNGAYDKTKFIITYENGQTYTGRIDIVYSMLFQDQPLKKHITDFCEYHGGEFKEFLNQYQLEDEKQNHISHNNNNNNVIDITSRLKKKQQQELEKQMLDYLINDVVSNMTDDEINELYKFAKNGDEKGLYNYLRQVELKIKLRKSKQLT